MPILALIVALVLGLQTFAGDRDFQGEQLYKCGELQALAEDVSYLIKSAKDTDAADHINNRLKVAESGSLVSPPSGDFCSYYDLSKWGNDDWTNYKRGFLDQTRRDSQGSSPDLFNAVREVLVRKDRVNVRYKR